ncbi:hypothetical protein DUNSADRAFT_6674 [Dunaliella salina]|uniref:Beta-carotene isomerase D27-like C-terminal domain-containing protein n=1 Tax=Dunaliella salina TaxID=3046 RepID=A0ABQ7GMU1_DUNSA|nr:hypothetical protein DUNSADRAFT_6674 [Dunaliella salina]|eukprot:KAF5835917.1 hypothetical protein DUNSADRAFT_6674 [Dunaliella salina]
MRQVRQGAHSSAAQQGARPVARGIAPPVRQGWAPQQQYPQQRTQLQNNKDMRRDQKLQTEEQKKFQEQALAVKPNYEAIEAWPHNALIQHLFRSKMVQALGSDVQTEGYQAIIDLTRQLNNLKPQETQARTVEILKSLFPSWLLPAFKVMFSEPMPEFACKMNAWATALTCEWLMGPLKVNDVEVDGGKVGVSQGVEVQRCRYLEEAGCTSICVNSCKVPTQTFFAQEMGLPLTMTPNYETYSCQFSFGATPPPQSEDPAFTASCYSQCPSKQRRKGGAFEELQVMAAQARAGALPAGVSGVPAESERCEKVGPSA